MERKRGRREEWRGRGGRREDGEEEREGEEEGEGGSFFNILFLNTLQDNEQMMNRLTYILTHTQASC